MKAHEHFNDEDWDGPPQEPELCPKCGLYPCQCVKTPPKPCPACGQRPCECLEEPCDVCGQRPCVCEKKKIAKVKLADGKARNIQQMVCTTFWHSDGTPMSAQQFMELLFGKLPEFFKDEDELRRIWSDPRTRRRLLDRLAEANFGHEQLAEMQKIIDAENSDLFDVLAFVAYALPPKTREERASLAKVPIHANFDVRQQAFLDFVLGHYVSDGVEELDQEKLALLLSLKYHGSLSDAVKELAMPAEDIGRVFRDFQKYLYPPPG
jgi:type I restriction enzyme R subunit